VLDVAVPEVGLQRPRVVPFVGQRITAGVPEHVGVRLETQLSLGARTLNHPGEASSGERRAPVCTENPIRIDWRRESPNVSAQ
jgi:hypothetical protein